MVTPKKVILTFVITATISVFSGCSVVGVGTTTDTISEMGVSVERPAGWRKTRLQHDDKYVDYVIDVPQKNASQSNVDGHVAINLSKSIGEEKLTIDGELSGLTKFISKRVTDLKTIEEKELTFMGQAGKRLILQFKNSEDKNIAEKLAVTLTIKENKAYAIILDEDTIDFDMLMPTYEQMTASMKFN